MLLTFLFIFPLICGSLSDRYDSIIKTNYGKVGGVVRRTRTNGRYMSFAGIPFAKPPLKNLRFANPERPEPWDHVLDGSKSSPRCIQRNYVFYVDPPMTGSEDCLYLNVYVPLRKNRINHNKFPVIVSIPWGGYIVEGADEGYFDPSYIMDYDLILVSLNYRVGTFGFLSTLDDEAPGNLGLKDQVLALEWVQENIEYFGGLKKHVTIVGQSSGAGSTHLHMISPASRGLFSKAISQSGNALAFWATPNNEMQKTNVLTQAKLVNCSDCAGDSKALIACLRNIPAEDLERSLDAFKTFYFLPYAAFPLVVEKKTERNPNPFLTKLPLEYVEAGEFQKVPWITGTVKNEGLLVASGILSRDEERETLNKNFSTIMPEILMLSLITNDTQELYQKIVTQYLGGNHFVNAADKEWQQGFIDMWSDRYFMYSLEQAITLQVEKGHNSIYFYSFEYAGEYTFAGIWADDGKTKMYNPNWTISHCDDLLYQFKLPELFKKQLTSITDIELSKTMLSMWVNFAKFGNPNPAKKRVLHGIDWKPLQANHRHLFTNDDINVLNITGTYKNGASFKITRGFNKERMLFWKENS